MRKDIGVQQQDSSPRAGWLLPYWRAQKWRIIFAAIMGTLAVACAGALLFTSGYLISRSAMQPYNVLMVYVPIVLVRTFGFGKAIIQYVERLISHDTVFRILSAMRVRLYRAVEPQAVQIRSRYRTGDFLAMLAEDIEQLQNVYLRLGLPAITAILILVSGIAALGMLDWVFALLLALYCGFVYCIVPAVVLIRSRHRRKEHLSKRNELYQDVTDTIFGMRDWVLSGRSKEALQSFVDKANHTLHLEKANRRSEWRAEWIMQCAIGGAVVMMAIWAGQMSAAGVLAAEWIAAYSLIAFSLLEAVVHAGQAIIAAPDYRTALNRLSNVEASATPASTTRSTDDRGGTTKRSKTSSTGTLNSRGSPAIPTTLAKVDHTYASKENGLHVSPNPHINLDRVGFQYPNSDEWSVRHVTLQIAQGNRIALIGRSGSGKSTLFKLIQGELTPQEGAMEINGVDASTAREHGTFSVMNQQPYLFDTTIANNIRLGRPDANDDEVQHAAERAGLAELLATLPEGIDTAVHEAGVRFSGGERQRIALARILLQDYPIVLLDEPTVGLDPMTERRIIDVLLRTLAGKTLIWITHHLTGMEQMDQIIFMEHGTITMQGSHVDLLQRYDRYRRLYELDRPI